MYLQRLVKALESGNTERALDLARKQLCWDVLTGSFWSGYRSEYVSIKKAEKKENGEIHYTATYRGRWEEKSFVLGREYDALPRREKTSPTDEFIEIN